MTRQGLVVVALCAAIGAPFGCHEANKSRGKASRTSVAAADKKKLAIDMAQFKNPTEADIPELTRLFHAGDKEERKEAALALGTIGSAQCIDPIVEALGDDDDYVRSYAMIGIARGISGKRSSPDFVAAIFPALVKLLNRDDRSVSGKAPFLLLAIDSQRAIPVLLSSDYFTVENRQLHYILRALNANEITIPHDKLLPLLGELAPIKDKYPHDYDYSEALIAYGRNPDGATKQLLRKELDSTNEKVARGASDGLAALNGVVDPYGHVAEIVEAMGFAALSEAQKRYYAVSIYGFEVDNGGHAQYFFNSSGDTWKSALGGLKAIGASKRAAILEEATSKFGPEGPSEDRVTRINQLRRLPAESKKVFDDLDSRFYEAEKAGEDFDVLLPLYAIENKAEFTSEKASP